MKTRKLVVFLIFLFTALSLSIVGIFSPTGLAQKQVFASTQSARLDERIRRVENRKLMSQATGQPTFELFAESETDFFLKESETEIKFVKNTQGKVTGLVSRERDRNIFVQKIK